MRLGLWTVRGWCCCLVLQPRVHMKAGEAINRDCAQFSMENYGGLFSYSHAGQSVLLSVETICRVSQPRTWVT